MIHSLSADELNSFWENLCFCYSFARSLTLPLRPSAISRSLDLFFLRLFAHSVLISFQPRRKSIAWGFKCHNFDFAVFFVFIWVWDFNFRRNLSNLWFPWVFSSVFCSNLTFLQFFRWIPSKCYRFGLKGMCLRNEHSESNDVKERLLFDHSPLDWLAWNSLAIRSLNCWSAFFRVF